MGVWRHRVVPQTPTLQVQSTVESPSLTNRVEPPKDNEK